MDFSNTKYANSQDRILYDISNIQTKVAAIFELDYGDWSPCNGRDRSVVFKFSLVCVITECYIISLHPLSQSDARSRPNLRRDAIIGLSDSEFESIPFVCRIDSSIGSERK